MKGSKKLYMVLGLPFLILIVLFGACSQSTSTTTTSQAPATTSQTSTIKPVELSFAHMFPPQSPEGQVADKWAEKVKQDSNGLLTVRVYPVGTLIAPPEMYSGVLKGAADIGMAFVYNPEGFEISALLPFILTAPDLATAVKVYDGLWKQFPDAMANEWKDVKTMWMTPSALQTLWFTKTDLKTLDDMKGLQLRVPSKEMGEVLSDLGATPVYMSTPDLAIGLEKGTVDGCINMYAAVQANKMTQLKYALQLANSSCGIPTPLFVVMNKDSYNKLDPSLQKVIDDSLAWGKQLQIETWTSNQQNAEAWFTDQGGQYITLSADDEAKWNSTYQQVESQAAQALDAKGLPASAILKYIQDQIKAYTAK